MTADLLGSPAGLARQPPFRLGAVQVFPATSEVAWGDQRETLQPKVMQVLVALASRRSEVISAEDLIDACWGGRTVGDDAVQRCIGLIRRLAERTGAFAVETVPRVGYRLEVGAENPPRSWRRPVVVMLLVLALLLAGAAAWFWGPRAPTPPPNLRIEVSALRAIGGETATSFAQDLRDDITGVLNQSGVQTTASGKPAPMFGRPGADLVLKGSVSQQGERLKVRIFLEDVRAGLTLWSGQFDRPIAAAQRLSDEVAVAATETIYTALEPGQQAGARMDPATLAIYIRGSELVRSPQPLREAEPREAFEQVVARAPKLAAGHAVLAITIANEARRGAPAARPALFEQVEREARTAIAIDPSVSGAAYDALYLIRRTGAPTQIVQAEDQILEGLRHAANHPFLNMRECRLLTEVGRAAEAALYCQRALALRPLAGPIGYSYALALNGAGEQDLADRAIEQAARRNPDHTSTRAVRFEMAAVGGPPEKARSLLRDPTTRPVWIGPQAAATLETYLAARDSARPADVETAAVALRKSVAAGRLDIGLAVQAAVRLGRVDDAFDLLALRGLDRVQSGAGAMFLLEPSTAPLRADPRFWPLAARLGLARYWVARDRWPDLCGREIPLAVCKAEAKRALREAHP